MAMLSCPLCCQTCFSSVDLLRTSLINVINRPLICPICSDVRRNLDDLAAHLTQHIEMPSQMGHTEHRDANNVIHNITINNAIQATAELETRVNQFDVTRKCDGNMTGKLDAPSCVPSSPPSPPHNSNLLIINRQIDQIARPVSYVCNLCDCSFRTQDLQQMHMQLVHEINVPPSNADTKLTNARVISPAHLQCYLCPKRFKMIGSLRLHVRMVHGVSHAPQKMRATLDCQPGINNSVQSPVNAKNELGTGDLIPSTTSSHVNSSNPPLVHNNQCDYYGNYGLADVTSFGCSEDSGSATGAEQKDNDGPANGNNNSKEMIASNEDRVHKCDICNKRFTTKYFLKKHKRLHTGEMPYTCELCHRTFTFQQSYHRHLSYHTNDRPHSCSICGRAFKELSTLHNHQRIHTGAKPFECETCGKCFRQRVSYLVHRRIHTGVMPYNCVTCDKKFRYKISLRTHKCTGLSVAAAVATVAEHTSTTNNDTSFIGNEQNMSTCSQSLDELISESCNRMGIVDQSEPNPVESTSYGHSATENGHIHSNQSLLHFDSFNLNDLAFCTGEATNTDLANVMPSMNEIFPQTIELMNALYDNVNAADLQPFYNSPQQ